MARQTSRVVKVAVLAVVLAALAALFLRTVRQSGAAPYTVRADRLAGWTLVAASARGGNAGRALVALRPSIELPADLFRQVFRRTMTSLSTPAVPEIPLVRAEEVAGADEVLVGRVLDAARNARLDAASPEPRCLARYRVSEPGGTLEFYYLVLDLPGFDGFRAEVARLLEPDRASGFDRQAVPVLLVAASERGLTGSLPFRADPTRDCIAPIVVE